MPIEIRRIRYNEPAAVELREAMDVEMIELYESLDLDNTPELAETVEAALEIHPEEMVAAVGAFDGDRLVGHAALRPFEDSLEVKRVIVAKDHRGLGISKLLMLELEAIARERGVFSLVLQTGDRQAEAIALYTKIGYVPIELFGLYVGVPFFLCYGKTLSPT
jgi:GNAT superfamily N-acetyltransferase